MGVRESGAFVFGDHRAAKPQPVDIRVTPECQWFAASFVTGDEQSIFFRGPAVICCRAATEARAVKLAAEAAQALGLEWRVRASAAGKAPRPARRKSGGQR